MEPFRIMVCTDTHIGYKEQDPIRGMDSINTFDEILRAAKEKKVDFILHGGDLFDENRPSRKTLFHVMRKLREYCMGDGEILFDCVNQIPPIAGDKVNYHDPSYNICLPFFCIHGNHDDPGESNLAAADILAGANLVNYIGRQPNCDTVSIKPVLLVKGDTKLALYGLGNIRDDRINRAFQSGLVQFERPSGDDWFNLLVLHQNRYKGNAGGAPSNSCVTDEMLPSWFNLVIWGHEHDCRIQPEESFHGEYFISQPGSSVATSLSQGEAIEKYVGILEIRTGKAFRLLKHKLHTVRPFYIDQLGLGTSNVNPESDSDIWSFLIERVEEMLKQCTGDILPLIRLKVEHTGYPIVASSRFGEQFSGRVANPDSLLLFHKQRAAVTNTGMKDMLPGTRGTKKDDNVFSFLEVDQLGVLPMTDFNIAVERYCSKDDFGAIQRFVDHTTVKSLSETVKIKTVVGREELMKTLRDEAETIRMLRDMAVKKDEESAPARVDVDEDSDAVEVAPVTRKRAKPAGKPRPKVASKKNAVESPSGAPSVFEVPHTVAREPDKNDQVIVAVPSSPPRRQVLESQPWLTPTPVPSNASVFRERVDSDLVDIPALAQTPRRMPWGLKK